MRDSSVGVEEFVGGYLLADSSDCMTCRVTKTHCFRDKIQLF